MLGLYALAALLTCLCQPLLAAQAPATPQAKAGLLDLTDWNPGRDGPISLDGEWEFYWGQLLTPKDFQAADPRAVTYITLPSGWNGFELQGQKLDSQGYATFRLRILPGPGVKDLNLRLFNILSAYKLWVNGDLYAQSGTVGVNESAEVPNPSVLLPRLRSNGHPMEVVLQVSNHNYRQGGIVSSIWLGPDQSLEDDHIRTLALSFFYTGSFFVIGVYHLALYCFRRKNVAPLFFGMYCLLWMVNHMTSESSSWSIRLMFSSLSATWLDILAQSAFFLSVPVGFQFFRSLYPQEFSLRLMRASQILAAVFLLLTFFTPLLTLSMFVPVYYFTSSLLILYCLAMLYRAWRNGREGAVFILAGFVFLGLSGINDMLADMGVIRSVYLLPLGMFLFILSQASALSLRFSRAFTAVERLSVELEDKNSSLEDEITERARLEREIVTVSEEERRRLSHDLHDGLCQQLTGARLRCSALARALGPVIEGNAEFARLSGLLEECVNHAYDLSRGLWPVEHESAAVGASLEELVRRFSRSSGIDIELEQVHGCEHCDNPGSIQVYRIAQEALANAVKHAKPSRIRVSLVCARRGRIALRVEDDGVGRRANAKTAGGLGLSLMAHRARIIEAAFEVADAPGGGTMVTCLAACAAPTG